MIRTQTLAIAWACAAAAPAHAAPVACADLVVLDANIRSLDAGQPRASALAALGGRVIALGDDEAVRALACAATRVIHAGGRLVLPGFNDSHVHFMDGGHGLSSVDLHDARSQREFARRIGDFAATREPGEWILNGNWDHESWSPNDLPTRQLIDAATPDNPVFVQRLDGHMALANSLALELAGITRDTPDPAGGEIVRDAESEPTGVLKDDAMAAVSAVIPERSFSQALAVAQAATDHAASLGVTSVQDMGPNRPGVRLALGTDWFVAPLDPMLTVHAAVTRATLDGKHPDGWFPAQKLTVEEAVRAYTVGSAHAEFQEHGKGTLAPGMLADFVIWSQDIFEIAPEEIPATRALVTVVDGRVVYEAD